MYTVQILERIQIADNMITLKTTKPTGFDFIAGQFIQFLIPTKDGDTKPRSYSIASIPTDDHLLFLVKLLPDGLASDYFRTDACIGTEISMTDARGRFIVDDNATSHLFVATGSGMAPIMSIIRDALEIKKIETKLVLYFGVRHITDIFWQETLATLELTHPNFTYHLTLSKPEKDWDGLRGRVTEHIEQDHAKHHAYLCGSAPMVMDVRKRMIEHGAEPRQIHFEIF